MIEQNKDMRTFLKQIKLEKELKKTRQKTHKISHMKYQKQSYLRSLKREKLRPKEEQ